MIFPLVMILAARLLGIGIGPQRVPSIHAPLACDLGNSKPLKLGSFKHNPKQTETAFQICFSNGFQLGILAELQGSRSSSVVLSSKPLVISTKQVVAER